MANKTDQCDPVYCGLWQIDDRKILHVDSKVIDMVVNVLIGTFGEQGPLAVTHGKFMITLG